MLTTRVIPCLDVRDGRVVKGVRFQNLRDAGDPAERAARYEEDGADELVMLDVSATNEGRATAVRTVREIRRALSIPLTVGGGIATVEDAARLLDAGADKVSVNSAAVREPELLTKLATRFGRQCTVIAVDAARRGGDVAGSGGDAEMRKGHEGVGFEVLVRSGTAATGLEAIAWVREAEARGAGEVLLTSFDRDGTGLGYDLELLSQVSGAVSIPVIASGGARTAEHLAAAVRAGADAVLAATIFHDGETTPRRIKGELRGLGVCVRVDGEMPEVVS